MAYDMFFHDVAHLTVFDGIVMVSMFGSYTEQLVSQKYLPSITIELYSGALIISYMVLVSFQQQLNSNI